MQVVLVSSTQKKRCCKKTFLFKLKKKNIWKDGRASYRWKTLHGIALCVRGHDAKSPGDVAGDVFWGAKHWRRRRRRFDFFFCLFFATTLLVSQDLDRLCFCPMYPKTDVRRLQTKGGAGTVLTFFFATPLLVSLDLDRLSFYPNESKIDFRHLPTEKRRRRRRFDFFFCDTITEVTRPSLDRLCFCPRDSKTEVCHLQTKGKTSKRWEFVQGPLWNLFIIL